MDTRPQESFGVTYVAQLVQYHWRSGWQEFDRRNDDVTDGIIMIRRKGRDTGDIIFTQIKCGSGYRLDSHKRPDSVGVNVGSNYIQTHRPRWHAAPGPMIMVYIDPSNPSSPESYWTDLRDPDSFTPDNQQLVLFPKHQRLGLHSKGDIAALCKSISADRSIPLMEAKREDVNYTALSAKPKEAARRFYNAWKSEPEDRRRNPALGVIEISRTGWRHMNRQGRKTERIISSWGLLGIAKKIILAVSTPQRLGRHQIKTLTDGSKHVLDFLVLRAKIAFPHRADAVVQVVIRRKRTINTAGDIQTRHWLYSVYELRRGVARNY